MDHLNRALNQLMKLDFEPLSGKETMKRIEMFRKVASLGAKDIEYVFKDNDHILKKYERRREEERDLITGNMKFVFSLDLNNLALLFAYLDQ